MPAKESKINVNLLIKEDIEESLSGQLLGWAFNYGRYIIIITQIVVLSVFFLRFKLDRDHTDLKEAVSQKQALVESVGDLETEIRRVQKRLSDVDQITSNQNYLIKVIKFLQDNTPSDTTFTALILGKDRIAFSASSKDLRSFSYFLRQLQQESKLSEVTLEDILRRPEGRIEFKINARINSKAFI